MNRVLTHEARRTDFGNCGEMAMAAYEYVKARHRNDLDFAVLRGLPHAANKRGNNQLARGDGWFDFNDKVKWVDFIDIDTDSISCEHCFLVLGMCWAGSGVVTDMKYGADPQRRWNAAGPVVICDPWMRNPNDALGAGAGTTVDLSSDAAYTSYFDSLIAWSVHKGYPMAPAAQQQGLPAQLELAMKKRYVNIRFNVDANNNSATKKK